MKKINNKNYRKFLDTGEIDFITPDQLEMALRNIKGKTAPEARSLLILLYYTGARPNEILRLKAKAIQKKGQMVSVHLPGSKGGLARTIYLPIRRRGVPELYSYACGLFQEMFMFHNYRNVYVRTYINKKGVVKQREEISNKLTYHIKKWFNGVVDGSIPPYFLRHNRFSKLAARGVDLQDIRMLKGARRMDSVMSYLHLSTKSAQNIAKKID